MGKGLSNTLEYVGVGLLGIAYTWGIPHLTELVSSAKSLAVQDPETMAFLGKAGVFLLENGIKLSLYATPLMVYRRAMNNLEVESIE